MPPGNIATIYIVILSLSYFVKLGGKREGVMAVAVAFSLAPIVFLRSPQCWLCLFCYTAFGRAVNIMMKRKLPAHGPTKPSISTVKDLRSKLKQLGLSTRGPKLTLRTALNLLILSNY